MLLALNVASMVLSVALQAGGPGLSDAYFYFIQGRTLEGKGDVAGALAAYKHAAELEPRSSTIHAEIAGLYARTGKANDSIGEAETALTLDKNDREAHRILGLVQSALAESLPAGAQQSKLMNDAAGHLELALASTRDPGAELTLGRLDVRLDRFDKGIPVLRNFLLDNPGYPEGVMLLAEAYDRTGDFKSAVGILEPVYDELRVAPAGKGDADLLSFAAMSLANSYQALGQFDRTEQVLRDLIQRDPRNDVALNALGYMLADRGQKLDEALTLVQRALVVQPASASYLDSLGWVYLKQGKSADAIDPLERATRLVESSSLLQDHLASAYFAAKRYKDAADAWTRALAGDRDGIDIAAVTKKRDQARALIK